MQANSCLQNRLKVVSGSVHQPVGDTPVSFFMGGLGYRLGQVEVEEEIHCYSHAGVLGTVIVDIEISAPLLYKTRVV